MVYIKPSASSLLVFLLVSQSQILNLCSVFGFSSIQRYLLMAFNLLVVSPVDILTVHLTLCVSVCPFLNL